MAYQHRVYRADGTYWVSESRDDGPRIVTTYNEAGTVLTSRPYTAAENAAADAESQERARQATRDSLTVLANLEARLTRLAAYKTDADVIAALARQNNTAATTAERNRLDKAILRRQARQDAALALLVRLIDPALLANVADTTDA